MNLGLLDHQFIFIAYPFCAGGTHLQNLISLDPNSYPKDCADHSELYNKLLEIYNDNTNFVAHNQGQHVIVSDYERFIKYLTRIDDKKYQNSVHIGHSYCYLKYRPLLKKFPNKKIIVISTYSDHTKKLIGQRQVELLGENFINNTLSITGLTENFLYSREFFQEYYNTNSWDLIEIEGSFLYEPDISNILFDINQEFNLDIPVDKALFLHNLWLKNIVKTHE